MHCMQLTLTLAEIHFVHEQYILKQREWIKLKTMRPRHLQYQNYAT